MVEDKRAPLAAYPEAFFFFISWPLGPRIDRHLRCSISKTLAQLRLSSTASFYLSTLAPSKQKQAQHTFTSTKIYHHQALPSPSSTTTSHQQHHHTYPHNNEDLNPLLRGPGLGQHRLLVRSSALNTRSYIHLHLHPIPSHLILSPSIPISIPNTIHPYQMKNHRLTSLPQTAQLSPPQSRSPSPSPESKSKAVSSAAVSPPKPALTSLAPTSPSNNVPPNLSLNQKQTQKQSPKPPQNLNQHHLLSPKPFQKPARMMMTPRNPNRPNQPAPPLPKNPTISAMQSPMKTLKNPSRPNPPALLRPRNRIPKDTPSPMRMPKSPSLPNPPAHHIPRNRTTSAKRSRSRSQRSKFSRGIWRIILARLLLLRG